MLKWMTRRNRWYSAGLASAWAALGAWHLSQGNVGWVLSCVFFVGLNTVWIVYPASAPDMP
jgi:Na+/melibiose symporter-like transporter